MINTKELRRLAQAALIGPDGVSLNWVKLLQDFQEEANPAAISELLDRLEAAEKERVIDEQRIADLMAELNRVGHENDALRAKIAEMEKQEPVAWYYVTNGAWDCYSREKPPEDAIDVDSLRPLYALPGAQPAPSIRPAALFPVIAWLRNGCDPMKAADELEMLAAAPEVKP